VPPDLGKGIFTPEPKYLCDPGEWIECNEGSVNTIQEFDGYEYKCVQGGDEFKWIDVSEKSEEKSINQVSILSGLIKRMIIFVAGFRLF